MLRIFKETKIKFIELPEMGDRIFAFPHGTDFYLDRLSLGNHQCAVQLVH